MHIPVLLNEVIEHLDPKPGAKIIDGTFGIGGHSRAIVEKVMPGGRILGIERDLEMVWNAGPLPEGIKLVHGSFHYLRDIATANDMKDADGIILDLGFSSFHVDRSGRGFSFRFNEKLDMRYDTSHDEGLTAEFIVNKYGEEDLVEILKTYGEERLARKIAKGIIETRKKKPITTTFELVEAIGDSVPVGYKKGRIHFATRTFQALRIATNDELNGLGAGLSQVPDILKPGGRLVAISFHSLEDRIVKNFFKNPAFEKLTKKPIQASEEEIKENPRARSAKLRAAIKK
jgi:16S rRNA (cytosine1402-N4)-methyltransferase